MGAREEIEALEERLRLAELGPDPAFFEDSIADDAVLVAEDGTPNFAKARVVAAHQPGNGPGFTSVTMRDVVIVEHGEAAVVTCKGTYVGVRGAMTLAFMRVWLKRDGRWQIIAGTVTPID